MDAEREPDSPADNQFFANYQWSRADFNPLVIVLGVLAVATVGNLIVLGLSAYDGVRGLLEKRRRATSPGARPSIRGPIARHRLTPC